MAPKTDNPKETIRRLLDTLDITRVIYVDDVFAATRDSVRAQCNDLSLRDTNASGVFPDVDFTIDDEDVVRALVLARVERFGPNELVAASLKLAAETSRGSAIRDVEVATKFGELLEGFDLLRLSRAEWLSKRMQLLSEIPSARTLFVFDEDFRGEGEAPDEGRRLLAQLQTDLGQSAASLALLTHTVADEHSELQLQDAITKAFPELQDRLIVVAKRRLAQEQEGFAWRVKLAVLNSLFVELKAHVQRAVKAATTAAEDSVRQLHVDAFERIVFRSSSREGVWAPETLVRVFGVHFEKSVFKSLRGDKSVHELAEKARRISQVETADISEKTLAEARRLQRTTIYADADDLNGLHVPIELGDVFEGDAGRFILIAQPCELMVREREGLRRTKDSDERSMIPLARLETRERKRREKKKDIEAAEEFELPLFDDHDDMVWRVKLNDVCLVPVWLLDLAAFNPEGRCAVTATAAASPLLVPAWKLRHSILLQRAEAIVARYHALGIKAGEGHSQVLCSVLGLPTGLPIAAAVDPTEAQPDGAWSLSVGLRRISRLREPYASALLTKYGHWLTRPAYPHDLTRIE